jgi:transposase
MSAKLNDLPQDREALEAMVRSLILEREEQRQRVEHESERANDLHGESLRQRKRADELYLENLRLQLELQRYKKWYYGPRADRLATSADLAQALLEFGEQLQKKPIHPEDVPPAAEPEYELRRVKRRRGRRNLANFENLPVTTQVYELSAEQRLCSCCGVERKEIGADESWQIEYIPGRFERLHHVRKKYACPGCERVGENPQMEVAAKAEAAIEKGMAGPGLLAYIVTSKFSDYLPLYRLEDIFERQGFEISRATQSIWCGDVADLVEPLYELMAERVRQSHVVATDDTIMPMLSVGKTKSARMWVYVGDEAHAYNVFDFTLNRGRDGPKYFLRDYEQVLLADGWWWHQSLRLRRQYSHQPSRPERPKSLRRWRGGGRNHLQRVSDWARSQRFYERKKGSERRVGRCMEHYFRLRPGSGGGLRNCRWGWWICGRRRGSCRGTSPQLGSKHLRRWAVYGASAGGGHSRLSRRKLCVSRQYGILLRYGYANVCTGCRWHVQYFLDKSREWNELRQHIQYSCRNNGCGGPCGRRKRNANVAALDYRCRTDRDTTLALESAKDDSKHQPRTNIRV